MDDTDDKSCTCYERRFSDRLRFLRNKKQISAREMSIALGQNVNYVNLIENGKRTPSLRGFFSMCDYLGTPPEIFFGGESGADGDELSGETLRHELYVSVARLTDAQSWAVYRLIQTFLGLQ